MATQELEIIIGSQVQDGIKGLSDIDKATGKLATDTAKASASISKSYAQINTAGKNLAASNQQLSKTVVNAGGTLTSFSRIVQDAPFGIIGVGNNITAFAEQFQFLQKQTGSAGGALKALAGSLAGAGGITLGISLLVTGITQLSQKYGSLGNAIDAILFPLSKQEQLQKSVNDTLLEGAKSAQQDIVSLDSLYRAATNVNIPLDQRNRIVDELQKQYPDYLGNLTNEQILTGQAATAYGQLRDAIIGKAQAQALSEKLAEIEGKKLPLLIEEQKLRQKLTTDALANAAAQRELNSASKEAEAVQDFILQTSGKVVAEYDKVKNRLKENSLAQGDLNEESRAYASLQDQIIQKFGAFALGVDTVTKAAKQAKVAFEELNLVSLSGRQDIFQQPEPIKFTQKIDISLVGLKEASERAQSQIGEFGNTLTSSVEKVNIDVEKVLQSGAATIATGIGSAIGTLVGGAGSLQDAFNAIIGVFADFISQLGQSMIAAGTATIAANALSTNPATAIIGGIIAVAAGAAIRAALSKTPSFATGGGVVGGPTLAMIGDNPGREEYVIPSEVLDSLGGGGAFFARTEVSGNNLAIIIEKAKRRQGRANG